MRAISHNVCNVDSVPRLSVYVLFLGCPFLLPAARCGLRLLMLSVQELWTTVHRWKFLKSYPQAVLWMWKARLRNEQGIYRFLPCFFRKTGGFSHKWVDLSRISRIFGWHNFFWPFFVSHSKVRVIHIIHRLIHRVHGEKLCKIKGFFSGVQKTPQVCTSLWSLFLLT